MVRDLVTDDRLDFALGEHLMRYAWETATGAGVGPEPKWRATFKGFGSLNPALLDEDGRFRIA